ncbi:MAG: 2-C-methyl-D-erythritol 4-phosphate cytidylyltransferase [Candidatus Omnitrophica bacterium]|nr:2-C-methyl-D-erythritol 4-phosphate cytidylyltransferase [Candidatus Omnitrophota bacterium]
MNVSVIIVAAGGGTRLKAGVPKAFVLLKDKPLIAHSLAVFQRMRAVNGIIVVGHKDHLKRFEALRRNFKKIRAVVAVGAARADSVKCGLAAVDHNADVVLVHDAARPLINADMVKRLLTALKKHKAVIAAVPVKATVKQVNAKTLRVERTLQRSLLWEAQTPQGFHKDVLVKAHGLKFKGEATDDAMLVERLGVPVAVVMGDQRNIKITTPEDLVIAKTLVKF